MKFKLYKQLTRISWDYENLKENVTGCILLAIIFYYHKTVWKIDFVHSMEADP